jgi:O-antigen/teichoic acid export membrane protein
MTDVLRLRVLGRNAVLNLVGHVAPIAGALIAIPFLVRSLGAERFGLLSLAWVLVGYFSLFDLGLGRALTRAVAEDTGTPAEAALPGLIRRSLVLMALLGLCASAAMFFLAPWLCVSVLRISDAMRSEATLMLRILSVCLPFVTLTAGLRGILEARQRFGWVNSIRAPMGLLTFMAPAAMQAIVPGLVPIAVVLAVLRVIAAGAHWIPCAQLYPGLARAGRTTQRRVASLLGFGAWLTVSNVIGPLMVYFDRFVIGAMLTVSSVAYYTAPYEVVTRLWLIPAALTAVVFPSLSAYLKESPARAKDVYRWSLKFVFFATYPLVLLLTLLAPDWLGLWLGEDYAQRSFQVVQFLAVGVLANSLAYVPYTLLQSAGRADLTAKLHLAELPFYFLLLMWLVGTSGISGAALAWALRSTLDAVVLFMLAGSQIPEWPPLFGRAQALAGGVLIVLLPASWMATTAVVRWPLLIAVLLLFLSLAGFVLLSPAERKALRHPWLLKDNLGNR